jgi:hypothetical protein
LIRINLTTFLDITSASGGAKVTALRQFKARGPYNPAHDFWRPLRLAIVEAHRTENASGLSSLVPTLTDRKKIRNYPSRVQAHLKWWGKSRYPWFRPPEATWAYGRVLVAVRAELGLVLAGQRTAVKLYFKADQLSKLRSDVILHLLGTTLIPTGECESVGILDVTRGRLVQPTVKKPDLEAALRGEAGYVEAAWDHV